ncbi:DUF423 domain-containing protein [Devosia sp. YIM 151766]|uniref:DUF423 domain-containing protein n=1 Tax=Devosia sp. YIM 151766 TaxID=3017325 RepID=UPI00255C8FB1|nr:DUF423 domain-containing protein [Devosia sp. YIM 151766]WIY51703.1 DUF423 domain-containing protein [Devosia sp. YIM 151766]
MQRVLLIVAGLAGAVGVAAAAAASHMAESRNLAAIAAICLSHGPALLALGLHGRTRPLLVAGCVLAVGTLLFAGDLAMREWAGRGLFTGAAPLGGAVMMLGWLGLAIAGLVRPEPIKKD